MSVEDIGSLSIGCGGCGSKTMAFDDSLNPESEVKCADCGTFIGTIAGIRALAETKGGELLNELSKSLKGAFKL